ncbi:unnamed protein product [Schistosoma rodhaini]|uniref:DNA replication complex GINS protein PSF3 n=1 Tax=Schistosoma rodhaini TaxID=6188 RepID=A0AA85FJD4_9TREM|nr:unnamed protein product [Schistosoma rodhaini]
MLEFYRNFLKRLSFIGTDWTLSLLHAGSYLNIDDILASNERTSCRVRVLLPSLAPLLLSDVKDKILSEGIDDGYKASDDVPVGKSIELPVWLAIAVGSGRRQILSIDVPPIYRNAFTEVFEADPCVVDLKRKGSMYYMLLCNLLMSGHVRVPQIVATGTKVFQSRLKMIMDASLNASRQDTLSSTSKFDSLEMALFRIGQTDRLQFERWISRHHEKIEALRTVRHVLVK